MKFCIAAKDENGSYAISLKYILSHVLYPHDYRNVPKGVMLDVISPNGNTGRCRYYRSGGSEHYISNNPHNMIDTDSKRNRFRISKK